MDAVNEFRKLLDVDLAKFQFSDFDDIKALNKKSFHIGNALNGVEDPAGIPGVPGSIPGGRNSQNGRESALNKTIELDDLPVRNALSKGVESFEDLVNKSLEKEKASNGRNSRNLQEILHEDPRNQQVEKRPFLRRGEGLKRFQNASKPISNTIEKVQESRRCIKAMNLRNENVTDKEYSRKVVLMPCQRSTIPKQLFPSSNAVPKLIPAPKASAHPPVHLPPRRPLSHPAPPPAAPARDYEIDDELLRKFSMLCQAQKDLQNGSNFQRKPEISEPRNGGSFGISSKPEVRKLNIVSKIDQLEQRLLYLLNLKSQLMLSVDSVDSRDSVKDSVKDSSKDSAKDSYKSSVRNSEDSDSENSVSEVSKSSKSSKSSAKTSTKSSLKNLKKEIVVLNDKITTIKNLQQEELLAKLQQELQARNEKESREIAAKKSRKFKAKSGDFGEDFDGDFEETSGDSEREVWNIPVKNLEGDGRVKTKVYKHANGSITTVYPTGNRVIQYPNGQIEKLFPDGSKQIIFPDNEHKIVRPDSSEELHLPDGRVYSRFPDGSEKVAYPNGDVEVKTKEYTKRHFANGNIKTVYSNGYQETLYSNGRIRLKDNHGNVLCDKRTDA